MANFLDDLSIYNAKAAAAISAAVVECNNEKANMMSSLKTTANDITLSEEIRLNALTALINLGNLLDIPLPPYFPSVTTYALTETFVGVHNDLDGLQGGAPGEYYHLTAAEKTAILNKASIGDISWANLSGNYSDNVTFGPLFDAKQDGLVAPAPGTYFVKVTGSTVSYDSNSYISTISGIAAGGELTGTYPNPTLSNAAVIGKVLTGWNGSVTGTITATDTILQALQKLNGNLNAVIASPGGVASVALTNNAPLVFTTTTTPQTGAASLSLGLNTQNANLLLASPNGTNGLPLFRALDAADLPNSGVTAATYGSSTVIPQIQVDAKGRITGVTSITAASGGQVNTVGLSVPGILSPSFVNAGTPSDPIITLALDVQTANYVWAGPETGADAVPSFRLLVEDDIPQLPITKIDGLDAFTGDFLSDSLGTSLMYIGNGSNKAVQAEVGGDIEALYDLINTTQTAVLTIKDEAVTYAKFQNIPDSPLTLQRPILLGRFDAGQGIMQQMTLSNDFTVNTTTGVIGLVTPNPPSLVDVGDLLTSTGSNNLVRLSLPFPNDGYLLMPYAAASSPACGLIWGLVDGDITYTVDDTIPSAPYGNFSIGANKVTLGKIAQIANNTVLGNVSGGLADVAPLTNTQLTTLVEQFNATNGGKVPSPGANFNNNTYFLNAAGGWSEVTGGGSPGGSNNQIQYKLGASSFGGTADMEYISGTGVYVTASKFFISNSASAKNFSINFDVSALGGDYQWSFPDAGSEFVGTDVSQTLTNKTLSTGSAINIGGGASTYDMWYSADGVGTITKIAGGAGNVGKYLKYTALGPSWEGVSVTSTANIDGGLANQILYQVDVGQTGFIVAPTTLNTYLKWTSSGFAWDTAGSGSGTVVSSGIKELAYYDAAGNTVKGLAVSGSNGTFILSQVISGGTPANPVWKAVTGSGDVVLATSPTLATPILGVASATSINKVAITAPATSATLTLADGSTLATSGAFSTTLTATATTTLTLPTTGTLATLAGSEALTNKTYNGLSVSTTTGTLTITNAKTLSISNTLTFTGTDGSSVAFGAGGTIAYVGLANSWASGIKQTFAPSATTAGINVGTLAGQPSSSPANGDLVYNSTASALQAYINGAWVSLGAGSSALSAITAATAANTINNANFAQEWQWNTLGSGNGFYLSSTSTAAASNTQTLFRVALSGPNATTTQSTFAGVLSNTHTGTSSTNYALQLTASGGTTNYALDVTAGIVRMAASTASVPHMVFTPGTAALTGSTNGMLSYATVSSNSSFYLWKDSAVTKLITLDRNPDFAVGSASGGVIISDTSGNLTKSADLTALGVYSAYASLGPLTTTAANSMISTSIAGSTTLPANYFALGKTVKITVTGVVTIAGASSTFSIWLGSSIFSASITGLPNVTARPFVMDLNLVCSAVGASATLVISGSFTIDIASPQNAHVYIFTPSTSSTFNSASSLVFDMKNQWINGADSMTVNSNMCYYIN